MVTISNMWVSEKKRSLQPPVAMLRSDRDLAVTGSCQGKLYTAQVGVLLHLCFV